MYNVAFVYTREAGGFEGVVTWSAWATEAEFDQAFTGWSEKEKKEKRILEKGISQERCIELVHQTPAACRIAAALQKSGGDKYLLERELDNVAFALASRES